MRIVILPVGRVERRVLNSIRSKLSRVFPQSVCLLSENVLDVPESTYNPSRRQYIPTEILSLILSYAEKTEPHADEIYRVLGVTHADLYAPRLNFVFGEAQCPGKAALISVHRLDLSSMENLPMRSYSSRDVRRRRFTN